MPLDAQHGWRRTDMVTADVILARLSAGFSLTPDDPGSRGSAPAEAFLGSAALEDLDGDVGGFDGGDREHSWLQAEFVSGLAAEQ
jgi:hypothetical protein